MSFLVIVVGSTQLSISYSELMADMIFLLVRILYSLTQGVKSNSRVFVDLLHDIPSIYVLSSTLADISFNSSCTPSTSNAVTLECHLLNVNLASFMVCVASILGRL